MFIIIKGAGLAILQIAIFNVEFLIHAGRCGSRKDAKPNLGDALMIFRLLLRIPNLVDTKFNSKKRQTSCPQNACLHSALNDITNNIRMSMTLYVNIT